MWYLFFQIWLWLIAAFALGWFAHWLLCCRSNKKGNTETLPDHSINNGTTISAAMPDTSSQPLMLSAPPSTVDDLKRIKGIGGVIEQTLNELGVYQFKQIADWDEHNIAWVENSLSFPGRINRENWVEQAKTLAQGGSTEFAQRVDRGDVGYDQ